MAGTQTPTPAQVAAGQARAGGVAPVTSSTKKKKTKTTTQLVDVVSSGINTSGLPTGSNTTNKKIGLDGRPYQSPIRVGEGFKIPFLTPQVTYKYTQYTKGSAEQYWNTLNNNQRAGLLMTLSAIPGVYAKNKALSQDEVSRYFASKVIPLRKEDVAAIENVMRFGDTVGMDVNEAQSYLAKNPAISQQFFNVSQLRGAGKKVSLTPPDILSLEIDQSFQDYLDTKADKDTINKYVDKVNALELNRGGNITSMERNKIMLDLVQEKAQQLVKSDAPDSLLMQRGALGGAYNALRKAYRDFGVNVDDKTVYKQAIDSIRSQQAFSNIVQKIQSQAQVAFPALEKYYAQGLNTREALANYIGLYSKMYNIPENDISVDKIYPAIKGKDMMSMDEWKKYLFSLPEFKNTDLYKQRSFNDAQVLMRNFYGGNA